MSTHNVEFPSDVRAKTDVSMLLVSFLAFLGTVAIMGAVYPFKGTFIRDLLMGRNEVSAERVVFQGLTIFMWMLSCANIVLKVFRIRREARALRSVPIPEDLDLRDTAKLVQLYEQLKALPKMVEHISLLRIGRVMAMWINTGDFQRTSEYAKVENELDIFLSDSSYRANRLFIWAMPLLGFVGTVYGVSYGIGGFADFLRGQVTAEEIKYQVGLITEGLAVAFYCTLLGLVTAGVAAFPSLAAERAEEEVLSEVDEFVQNRLISRMPSVREQEFPVDHLVGIRHAIENIKIDVAVPTDDIRSAIEAGFRRLPDPERYEEVFLRSIGRATTLVEERFSKLSDGYSGGLENVMGGLAESVRETGLALELSLRNVAKEFREFETALFESHQRMLRAEVTDLRGALSDVQTSAAEVAEKYAESSEALQTSTRESAEKSLSAATALSHRMADVAKMAASIEDLLKVEQSVEKGLAGVVAGEDFRKTLGDLRSHLEATDNLCRQLSKPRVITLQEQVEG